jgi:cysteinyl-tRNA synthetase
MALRLLGEPPIDLHAGGVDLIFPHHENEIAQAEGATGRQFSRFWLHAEHLMIDDEGKSSEKMSKSLGNVYNLEDVRSHGLRPSALRYLYLGVHYRKQLKFSWAVLAQAEEALKRLTDFLARLDHLHERDANPEVSTRLKEAGRAFHEHVTNDLNTAAALGVLFDLVRALNTSIDNGELGTADAAAVRAAFDRFDRILGVLSLRRLEDQQPPVPVEQIQQLIEARRAARRNRDFLEADRIRAELDARGIILEDTGAMTRWKRK